MLNNFIYAQTKDLFLEALNAGNILDEAIVFIEDTKEIWNHGHYFGGGDNEQVANIISQISQITTTLDTKATKSELSDYAKTSAIPTKVSQLTNDSNYLTQTQADELYIALSQLELINNSLSQLNTAINKKLDADTASSTYALKTDLDNKQDKITDLDDIRSNAEKGATAVQPEGLNNINTSISNINTTLDLKLDSASAEGIYAKIADIPTNNDQLENGAGYITIEDIANKYAEKALETTVANQGTAIEALQAVGAEANIQSDWNATEGDAFIKNKPDLSVYLKSSDAENIYATQTTVSDLDTKVGGIETAFDNYKTSVSETYLTKNDASTTYAKSGASYTKQESDDKYLTSDALTPYATNQGLSALNTTVTTLSGTVTKNTENISGVSDRVEVIEDYFDGVADADNALNKWHEIVNFLDEIDDTSNLAEILKGKANQTALDSTNAEVATIKGWGNHAKAGYQAAIDDLGTIRTNASNGAIAYGWGNHADAKYATTDNLNALSTTVATLSQTVTDYIDDCSVSKSADGNTITVKINGTAQSLTNSWRGISDSVTNGSSSISASEKAVKTAYDLANSAKTAADAAQATADGKWTYNADTIKAVKVNSATAADSAGSATSATKLSAARTLWGQSFNGTADISGALTGVSSITMTGNIKMGDATISYDSTQKCIKFSF